MFSRIFWTLCALNIQCVYTFCVEPLARATGSSLVINQVERSKEYFLAIPALMAVTVDAPEFESGGKSRYNSRVKRSRGRSAFRSLMSLLSFSTDELIEESVAESVASGEIYHSFDTTKQHSEISSSKAGDGAKGNINKKYNKSGRSSPQDYLNYHVSWLKSPTLPTAEGGWYGGSANSDTRSDTQSSKDIYVAGYYDYDPKKAAEAPEKTKSH